MFKDILQLIGVIALVLVVVIALFFLLDNVHLLSGQLGAYVSLIHDCFKTMSEATKAFLTGSGLANEAANLLDSGADKLRDAANDLAAQNGVVTEPAASPVPQEPISGADPTVPDAPATEAPVEIVFATPGPAD